MKAGQMTLSMEDRRLVGRWAADCAERVLPLFEAEAPSDTCPREAIEGIRVFASGGKRTAQLRSLALAAYAAARESGDPVAAAAARSAGAAARRWLANSRQAMLPEPATRKSDGRSITPRRQSGRLCVGGRFASRAARG
jgi:hypothetical protein